MPSDANNGEHKNTQALRISPPLDELARAFKRANEAYACLIEDERSALDNAMLTGKYLNSAKRIVKKEKKGRWLAYLESEFDGSIRKAQSCMELARQRDQIEHGRRQYPNLTIDEAHLYLRTGSVEKKSKRFDIGDFIGSQLWSKMLKETWHSWTAEEKEWARFNVDLFQKMMDEFRIELLKRNVPRRKWKDYLGSKKLRELDERLKKESRMRYLAYLNAWKEGANGLDPEELSDEDFNEDLTEDFTDVAG